MEMKASRKKILNILKENDIEVEVKLLGFEKKSRYEDYKPHYNITIKDEDDDTCECFEFFDSNSNTEETERVIADAIHCLVNESYIVTYDDMSDIGLDPYSEEDRNTWKALEENSDKLSHVLSEDVLKKISTIQY
jgi:hypothetical protein